jgi:hypothetical protein
MINVDKCLIFIKKKKSGEYGFRTHADLRPVDLKSTALTTRPTRLIKYIKDK